MCDTKKLSQIFSASFRVRPIRTSDISNIGAKMNIRESVASLCRYVIVTRWHAFNKLHSPLSMSVAHIHYPKNKANLTAVNIGIGIGHQNFVT